MPVQVTCASCGAMFAAQPHLYGQQVPCPNCGGALTIPHPEQQAPPPAPPDDPLSAASLEHSAPTLGPAYCPVPGAADAPMSGEDKKVIMYAVLGVGGILFLLVVAMVVTSLLSGGDAGQPATAGDNGAATSEDGQAKSDSSTDAAASGENASPAKPTPGTGKSKPAKSGSAKATSKPKPQPSTEPAAPARHF